MTESAQSSRRARLARNTVWNLLGMIAPMAVALVAIPLLIQGLGKERFGLLSLVWMIVGYFSVFDLGLGRALTRALAEKIDHEPERVPATFWTAMTMMLILGTAGAIIVYAGSPWLVFHALKLDPSLQPETLRSFRAVAFGLPVLITVTGLVGALEVCQRFPLINMIRIPTGAFTFVGPLLVLPFSHDLFPVVLVLLAGRLAEWALFWGACMRFVPGLRQGWSFDRADAPRLLSFGGWMTVSNIVQPLMVHIDRFLIGSIRSVADVAYYVTSAEIVVKLLIFPRAWVSVLFPTFAADFRARPEATGELFAQSVRLLLAMMFPICAVIAAFAPEGLSLWLGADFGTRSAPVMRWLIAGIFVYALAFVPTSLLQGTGRPDLTAKIHALEVPVYLALASWMISRFGIQGAAAAWVLRAALDFAAMSVLAARRAPTSASALSRVAIAAFLCLCALAALSVPRGILAKSLTLAIFLGAFAALAWRALFTESDRRIVRKRLDRLRGRVAASSPGETIDAS